MAPARTSTLLSDPASDRASIQLSQAPSTLAVPPAVRFKRRFQNAAEQLDSQRAVSLFPEAEQRPLPRNQGQSRTDDQSGAQSRSGSNSNQNGNAVRSSTTIQLGWERTNLLTPGRSAPRWMEYRVTRNLYQGFRVCWIILASNYANILLVLLPIGYIGYGENWSPAILLVMNGLAMLPLTQLAAMATEELAAYLGSSLADVLTYTCSNVGTIIITGIMLKNSELTAAQNSLLGALVFNLLAVMGCQYLAGGIRYQEQMFNETIASLNGSILLLATSNVVLPAVLYSLLRQSRLQNENVAIISYQLSICSVLIYLALLLFQCKTHAGLYDNPDDEDDEEEERERFLSPLSAFTLLILAGAALTVATEFFVDTLETLTNRDAISRTFVTFIFLPIVSNALAHVTEIGDAWLNKLDKATNSAIGCSVQIALFIIPCSVIIGWIMKRDMTMRFQTYPSVCAFLAVLLLNSVRQNGKSNFLEGLLLLNAYLGITVGAYCLSDDISIMI